MGNLLPYATKAGKARRFCSNRSFIIFALLVESNVITLYLHSGTLTLRTERQSARMSKITNDGLTRSGIGCFIAVPIRQQ